MTEKNFNTQVIEEFRANGGKVGGYFEGAPMLILTSIGAKSGTKRAVPLVYGVDGDNLFVLASKGGAPTHPDWYHNLVANPHATVEIGTETYQARATNAEGTERDRLYKKLADERPGFWDYVKMTDRVIPVVRLERIAG